MTFYTGTHDTAGVPASRIARALEPRPCLQFFVHGTPAPQGSKRYLGQKGGKGITVESNKRTAPWRADVRAAALLALTFAPNPLWDSPLNIELEFFFLRPKSHFGTGRNADKLKPSAPAFHAQTPDADKLARAALDAMTSVIYADDKTICDLYISKRWGEQPGAHITIWEAKA